MSEKKYYWLKLKKDFFKRHDIQIIESMPNGKEYILFYLKLLCESIDHEGMLRFSEDIPYTAEMLATITGTDKQIADDAIDAFAEFGIVEILEDGTFHLKQAERMIGEAEQDEHTRESARLRAKAYRERKKAEKNEDNVTVTLLSHDDNVIRHGEIELEKEIEIDIESIEKKRKRIVPPTLEEVKAYCQERKNNVDPVKFFDYYQQGQWKDSKGNPVKNWKQKLITWENKETKTEKPKSNNTIHFGNERTNIDFEALKKRMVVN